MRRSTGFLVGAALAAAPLCSSAQVVPPDGSYTYVYASTMAQSKGTSTITVRHTGSNVQVVENSAGTIGQIQATATTTQTLGTDLAPVAYTATYAGGGMSKSSSLTLTATQAQGTMPNGQHTFALEPGIAHFIILDGATLGGFFILPAQMHAWQNAQTQLIAPVYGQSARLMLDNGPPPDRPANVPAKDSALSVSAPVAFTVWYDPATFVMDEFDVPSQGITVTRQR